MLDLVDRRLAEAVDALREVDAHFAERYLEKAAQRHMAAGLRWRRAQETPSERTALVDEVNTLREGADLGLLEWEQVVTDLPVVAWESVGGLEIGTYRGRFLGAILRSSRAPVGDGSVLLRRGAVLPIERDEEGRNVILEVGGQPGGAARDSRMRRDRRNP